MSKTITFKIAEAAHIPAGKVAHNPAAVVVVAQMAAAAVVVVAEAAHIVDTLVLLRMLVAVPDTHNFGSSWVVAEAVDPFHTQELAQAQVVRCNCLHPSYQFGSLQSPLHCWSSS